MSPNGTIREHLFISIFCLIYSVKTRIIQKIDIERGVVRVEKIISAAPYYYGPIDKIKNTVRITVQLKDDIEGDILELAVKKAMTRYPYFCKKIHKTNQDIVLEDNSRDIVVQEGKKNLCLASSETNEHLLAFLWWKQEIYLDFFHGMADGIGIFPLIKTVLYYYCKERYDASLSSEGVRLMGEKVPLEEVQDPFLNCSTQNIQPVTVTKPKQALNLKKAGLHRPGTPTIYHIRIPEKSFMKFSSERDGSPAVVIALLMSKAIDCLYPDEKLPIIFSMTMNIRNVLKKPLAHQSVITQLYIEYKNAMKKKDTFMQVTCLRGMLFLQGLDENILFSVQRKMELAKKIDLLPDIQSKCTLIEKLYSSFKDLDTFGISYVGKADLGAAEKYVEGIYSIVGPSDSGFMVEINAVNGYFYATFLQEWEDDLYIKSFMAQLEQENIPYEVVGKESLVLPPIQI